MAPPCSAGTFQIGNDGASGTVATGNITNNGALRFDRTGTLQVPNAISGTGALTIDCPVGAGTIELNGTNSFSGAVTITSGALRITNSTALGTGTKTVKINTGTAGNPQLLLNGSGGSIVVPATISYQTSNETNGAIINEAGNNTIAGAITLTGGGGGTQIFTNAGTLTLSGPINSNFSGRTLKLMGPATGFVTGVISNGSATNVVGVNKEGTGTWTLSGNNTHGGGTNIVAGRLIISHPNALGDGGLGSSNGGTSITAGAVLDLNGQQAINEAITVRGTGISNGGALINSSTTPASISSGVINISTTAGGVHSSVPVVTISGSGGTGATATATLGLSAASFTITGGTTVYSAAPTATISGGGGSGASATAVLTGGVVTGITIGSAGSGYTTAPTIAFTGGTVTTAGTNPTGTGNATKFTVSNIQITNSGNGYTSPPNVTFGSGTGTTATASLSSFILGADSSIGGTGNMVIHPGISGGFSLTKSGSGIVTLNGVGTHTGGTTISAGTLALGVSNALPATAVSIGSASLNAATFTDILGTLDVTGSAVISLGSAAALTFADSSAIDWTGGTLAITGNFISGSSLRFGTNSSGLTANQLARISKPGGGAVALNTSGFLIDAVTTDYVSWASTNASSTTPAQDQDRDGVSNAVEYVLGGNVLTNDLSKLPAASTTGGNMLFTFQRDQSTINATTAVSIQVGTTLSIWPASYTVGTDTATSSAGVTVLKNVPVGFDTVTLSIPQLPDANQFARLSVVITP